MKIPQIDGKDLILAAFSASGEYSIQNIHGEYNCLKYRAALDDSMDLEKLREVYYKTFRNSRFSFRKGEVEYSHMVISVTFNYVVREFNRAWGNAFVKMGETLHKSDFTNCVCVRSGELIGVIIEKNVEEVIDTALLGGHFYYGEDGCYHVRSALRTVKNSSEIREELYEHGFWCDGVHYVRWKRSAGSARVGKCLFIAEPLFVPMRKWERCGLKVHEGDSLDLAAFESYVSLTSSSRISTIRILPENILVVNDCESVFEDDVVVVKEMDGLLDAEFKKSEIRNSLFDGESLIDPSLMGEYAKCGMVLLRNRFFKSCCFNCNIQQWFADNGIRDVKQLNGKTTAKRIEDVKLITTPSSIKYLKFGKLKNWLSAIDPEFGVVKYEKPSKFMGGDLVQAHYQLLNSISLSPSEIEELLKPTFEFISSVRADPSVLQHWISFAPDEDLAPTSLKRKSDIIYRMMSITPRFCETKLYYDFRSEFIRSFLNNVRSGRLLIEGNYSTLCGNPIELLKQAIGAFDGTSSMEIRSVYTTRFEFGEELIASRSPHITMSNVWLPVNRRNDLIEAYMNPTDEIVYVNAIDDNILQRLAGCDYDSDSVMLSNNRILVNAAKRSADSFPVAVCTVEGLKRARTYTASSLADLDVKTSENLIGEIVNVSQELNTLIWDKLADAAPREEIMEIYLDVCKLSIMSGIEIDKAKKEFLISNGVELNLLRDKHRRIKDGKRVKPYFFAHVSKMKGYYNSKLNLYERHKTTMDYLQTIVNRFSRSTAKTRARTVLPFSALLKLDNYNRDGVYRVNVKSVFETIDRYNGVIQSVFSDPTFTQSEKYHLSWELRSELSSYIGKLKINPNTAVALLKKIEAPEHRKYRMLLFYTLFSYPNESFYQCLSACEEHIPRLVECDDGEIEIYGSRFTKI